MKNDIHSTEIFDNWIDGLNDRVGRIAIFRRIERASNGNFGDHKPIAGKDSKGLQEMVIDFGPGYRVYYGQTGNRIYLLVCGGIKKTQAHDITLAKQLWRQIKEQEHDQQD